MPILHLLTGSTDAIIHSNKKNVNKIYKIFFLVSKNY